MCHSFVEKFLTTPGEEYIYQIFDSVNGDEEELKLYVDAFTQNPYGTSINLELDRLTKPQNVRGRKPVRYQLTVPLGVQIFREKGWPTLVGVFGRHENARKLRSALRRIYIDKTGNNHSPLSIVFMKLRQREEALLQLFPNMKKFKVTGIQGSRIRSATIAGDMLSESPEYQRWVKDEDYCGSIQYFGVSIGGATVTLGTEGKIYSTKGKQSRPVGIVYNVLRNLIGCNAIAYYRTLDTFNDNNPVTETN